MNLKFKLLFVLSFSTSIVLAQKTKVRNVATGPIVSPIKVNLPDLSFDLVPVILTGGDGIDRFPAVPTTIKMDISFIVKNTGFVNSKPAKVYAAYTYMGKEQRGFDIVEVRKERTSNSIDIPAVEHGKDILLNKLRFTWTNTPDDAFGKDIMVSLVIVSTGHGSQPEITTKNNHSAEVLLLMPAK